MDGNGPAFYSAGNIDTYLNLQPKEVAADAGGSSSLTVVLIVVVVVAVAALALLILWSRRRPRAMEE